MDSPIVAIAFAFVLMCICPLTAGFIADRKGHNVLIYAALGLFFGVFGVLIAAVVPRRATHAV